MRAQALVALGLVVLSACSTTITIKKVGPDDKSTPGQRFSLPSRFVMVEPQPDGHVEVKFVHLPDDNNTFAISSESVMTKQTLSVTVAAGLLTNVSNKGYATATATQLLTSAGNVRQKEITTEQANIKAAQTELKTLDQQIREAELALKQAEEKLRLAEIAFPGNEEKRLPYRAEVGAARLKLDDLNAKRLTLGNANEPGIYNDPSVKPTYAAGPAFFKIDEDYTTDPHKPVVKLVLISFDGSKNGLPQETFQVIANALPPRAPGAGAECPDFSAISKGPIISQDGARIINWTFAPNFKVTSATVRGFRKGDAVLLTIDGSTGKAIPVVGFPRKTDDSYDVWIDGVVADKKCEIRGNVPAPNK